MRVLDGFGAPRGGRGGGGRRHRGGGGHGGGGRPGHLRWRGLPPPRWGYGPRWNYGYDYWPSDVYYVGDVYTVQAYNAARYEVIGQGVSWSAAMIGARAYMQNNPAYVTIGEPLPAVRILAGYGGSPVCEWRGAPDGSWRQAFCNAGFYGVGTDPEAPPATGKSGKIAFAVVGVVTLGALAWMAFGAKSGSRYGFPAR